MPSSRPGFDDLKRRYREADWVSEFQRLWAIFNYWLYAYYQGNTKDRDCIEKLKENQELCAWVQRTISRSAYNGADRVGSGYLGSAMRFGADNEISRFFLAAQESPTMEPRINWPWRIGSERRVCQTHAVALTKAQFRSAYVIHANLLASEWGIVQDETFHQALAALNVHASGCCFFRRSIPVGLAESTQ